MKVAYKNINMRADTLQMIAILNDLIDTYVAQGFTLSVRQLYYQLVARDHVPNTEQSYKRVASIINDGRMAGLIDWDTIEDRGRDIELQTRWESGEQIVQAAASGYHMDMWDNQPNRLFVIVEKAALAGVLGPVCRTNDIPLLAARGYPSVSIVREIVMEHIQPAIWNGQNVVVVHMGDHDPSGIDMTRDLDERISLFLGEDAGSYRIKRVALTRDQIDDQRPPPNPAKTTDSRFLGYRRIHGDESWELDALQPRFIADLVEHELSMYRDDDLWTERSEVVESIRSTLKKLAQTSALRTS